MCRLELNANLLRVNVRLEATGETLGATEITEAIEVRAEQDVDILEKCLPGNKHKKRLNGQGKYMREKENTETKVGMTGTSKGILPHHPALTVLKGHNHP